MNASAFVAFIPLSSAVVSICVLMAALFKSFDRRRKLQNEAVYCADRAANLNDGFARLSKSANALVTRSNALQEKLAAWASEDAVAPYENEPDDHYASASNTLFMDFLNTVAEWISLTGKKMSGAAGQSLTIIHALTKQGEIADGPEEAEKIFAAASESLVEYLVRWTDENFTQGDHARMEQILGQLAEMAQVTWIDPEDGDRWDAKLHEIVKRVESQGKKLGTISQAVTRGLIRSDGTIIKARVYLYD